METLGNEKNICIFTRYFDSDLSEGLPANDYKWKGSGKIFARMNIRP